MSFAFVILAVIIGFISLLISGALKDDTCYHCGKKGTAEVIGTMEDKGLDALPEAQREGKRGYTFRCRNCGHLWEEYRPVSD